jgi:hypothetical protein
MLRIIEKQPDLKNAVTVRLGTLQKLMTLRLGIVNGTTLFVEPTMYVMLGLVKNEMHLPRYSNCQEPQ